MVRWRRTTAAALAAALVTTAVSHLPLPVSPALAADGRTPISEEIARRLAVPGVRAPMVGTRTLGTFELVRRFYEERNLMPAWTGPREPRSLVLQLLEAVKSATRDGLDPEDYHATELGNLLADLGDRRWALSHGAVESRAALELIATDAYFKFAAHALIGHRGEEPLRGDDLAEDGLDDAVAHLEAAIATGTIFTSLTALLPTHDQYPQLRRLLASYRRLAAKPPWLEVPQGRTMQLGNRDVRVPILRARLAAEPGAGLSEDVRFPQWFDGDLDRVVRDFQRRHGLEDDGVVGTTTVRALNVPAEQRVRQIELNLERWRRLPRNLGSRHLFVNIAAAELDAVEHDRVVARMRVVVGNAAWQTPVLSSTITHFVINPYWIVPRRIAVESLLPNIVEDPEYLRVHGFRVYDALDTESGELDAATIEWSELGPRKFPYRLRQEPGPDNALGRMKFVFPNRYSVYLHDTPVRDSFVPRVRTRSHGCVRLENPDAVAEYLIAETEEWSRAKLLEAIAADERRVVRLDRRVPVHLAYLTAWVSETGAVQFRRDYYGRDRRLAHALDGI